MGLSVLVVTRDRLLAGRLVDFPEQAEDDGHDLHHCQELGAALRLASHYGPDLVFIDETYGAAPIRSAFAEIRVETPLAAGVVLTAAGGEEARAYAASAGGGNYLPYTELSVAALDSIFNSARRRGPKLLAPTRMPWRDCALSAARATESGGDLDVGAARILE